LCFVWSWSLALTSAVYRYAFPAYQMVPDSVLCAMISCPGLMALGFGITNIVMYRSADFDVGDPCSKLDTYMLVISACFLILGGMLIAAACWFLAPSTDSNHLFMRLMKRISYLLCAFIVLWNIYGNVTYASVAYCTDVNQPFYKTCLADIILIHLFLTCPAILFIGRFFQRRYQRSFPIPDEEWTRSTAERPVFRQCFQLVLNHCFHSSVSLRCSAVLGAPDHSPTNHANTTP